MKIDTNVNTLELFDKNLENKKQDFIYEKEIYRQRSVCLLSKNTLAWKTLNSDVLLRHGGNNFSFG